MRSSIANPSGSKKPPQHPSETLALLGWIRLQLSELAIDECLRNRVSASCFAISHEHHRALLSLLLMKPPATASAFALVRPQFEAYARGMWLWRCATDQEVEGFRTAGTLPKTSRMMNDLAATEAFEGIDLRDTYRNHWSFMCAYVHTGVQQVSRWSEGPMISSSYSDQEVLQVIHFSEKISVFTGLAVAVLAGAGEVARRIANHTLSLREHAA